MDKKNLKKIVKDKYKKAAKSNGCCCRCSEDKENDKSIAKMIGYEDKEISEFSDANLGLGCGNPVAFGQIEEGDVVSDLGSGAGFDCFIAAKKVGKSGKVIGVDMTEEMIAKAEANAKKIRFSKCRISFKGN